MWPGQICVSKKTDDNFLTKISPGDRGTASQTTWTLKQQEMNDGIFAFIKRLSSELTWIIIPLFIVSKAYMRGLVAIGSDKGAV
jgi:hypothetical protein